MRNHERIILFISSIIYACIGSFTKIPTFETLSMIGWFGLIQFIYCICVWINKGNQLISPYVIFLLTLYLFSFGQSFLWALRLESDRTLIGFQHITISEIFDAQILTLIMLAFFQLGASFASQSNNIEYRVVPFDSTNRLRTIGWILFAISILPYSFETYENMVLSVTQGYAALYAGSAKVGISNWSSIIADYCIPSMICLFVAYRNNRVIKGAITLFFIINIIVILITGGRTNAVILLAIIIILHNYLVKKITRKWIVVGCIGCLFFLQILSYISEIRVDSNRSTSVESVRLEDNGAVDAIAEMGSSMFCLIKTMNLVPDFTDYRYGKSYLYAFTSLIPNLGFWDIHPAKIESNLSDWLTETLGLDYGTGFSMCAEAYANFGYFCFLVFFLWGWFVAKIFGKIEYCEIRRDYAQLVFLLILFWFFLTLPRNNFINIVRPLFFIAGPIYVYSARLIK